MKKYICLFLMATWFVSGVCAQEENAVDLKTQKKLTKQERAVLREAEAADLARMVDSLVEERKFVLEADFLSNQTGNRVIVNNLLNFIIVDSSKIIIQIASTTGLGGPNGMGGVTTRGNITGFEVKKTGKNNDVYFIRLVANTTIGPYDIFLHISPGSNTDATVSGIRAGKLNYHGFIKPLEQSRVFKGMTI